MTEHNLAANQTESNLYALSFNQKAMWFHYRYAPMSTAYNVNVAGRTRSEINIPALKRALQELTNRHLILRTSFINLNGELMQEICNHGETFICEIDASSWSDEFLNEQVLHEAHRPLNLIQEPLLQVFLFTQRNSSILLLKSHHMITDFLSFSYFLHELGILYTSEVQQMQGILEPVRKQYTDFVHWQTNMLINKEGISHRTYWEQQLSHKIPVLNLPINRRDITHLTNHGAAYAYKFDEGLIHKLKTLAQKEETTLYKVLLAAFLVLLYHYTTQEDILIGTFVPGRNHHEFDETLGYFSNMVCLRTSLDGNLTFLSFLGRIHQKVLEVREHGDYPFFLVNQLREARNNPYSSFPQVAFNMARTIYPGQKGLLHFARGQAGATLDLGSFVLESVPIGSRDAQFDLTLTIDDRITSVVGLFEYNTDLYETSTITRMAAHFHTLLNSIVFDPTQPLFKLSLLTRAEQQQLLVEWPISPTTFLQDCCVHQLFETQVAQTPEAIALAFEEQHLTYEELNRQANHLAWHLQQLGVGPEILVGLCLERSLALIVGVLGILKAGGAYLPLDPSYPSERISFMLRDASVPVLLTQEHLVQKLPLYYGKICCVDKDAKRIAENPIENPFQQATTENLAYIMYTSGSTGQPKGVLITHKNIVRLVKAAAYAQLDSQETFLQFAPISFDASTFEIWGSLLNGARLMIFPPHIPSLHELGIFLLRHHVSTLWLTAGLFQQMVENHLDGLHGVRQLLAGGDALSVMHVHKVLKSLPSCHLINGYGPTENTTFSCCFAITAVSQLSASIPIGRPITNTQTYVLDPWLRPVPVGIPGELYIGGTGLARGYLNQVELTAQRFVPHPWSQEPGMRLYRTGDLVRYLPDGNLEFLGRNDEQVKVRGFRVELGEIEAVLNQHPQVQTSAVILRETEQQDKQLVAYVVSKPGMALASSQELQGYLRKYLPAYMIPAWFEPLEQLPLTVQGKVDRKALPAVARKRQEGEAFREDGPRTPLEDLLVGVWQDLLEREQIGVHEDFFALGGHSLLATRLLVRLQALLHIDVPLRTFFEAPTVAKLSAQIEASGSVQKMQTSAILSVSRRQDLPLSFAQQRLWFLNQLEPENTAYNVPFAIHLTGILHISVLKRSLEEIMRRHEALRTNFEIKGEHAVQVIRWFSNLGWSYRDLSQSSVEKVEDEANKIIREQIQYTFNLRSGPLLCAMLLKLSKEEYVLLLMMPHIIWDGWSQGIFLRELAALYTAFLKQVPASLPELPIQYADFALWQRNWLQGSTLEALLAYWTHQLRDIPALLPLPTDYPRPIRQTYQGARYPFTLPPAFTEELRLFSRRQGGTLFMTLLTACQILLARYTGLEDIVVGSPIANRNRIELEGLIGCFVNTLVLRGDLTGDPTVRQLLQRTREMTLQAYAHQDLPFEKLVEELAPQRTLNYHPVFQVLFVLQNMPVESLELPGLQVRPYELESYTTKFDLGFFFQESQDGLRAVIEYSTDLFSATTIHRLSAHYQHLLQLMLHAPDQRIHQISFLTEEEREQLLYTWNATHTTQPAPLCLHELFEAQTQRIPDAIAVLSAQEQITYECLELVANKRARQLQQLGVTIEATVGLRVERSLALAVGVLAILKAGAAYVPIDPTYPQERQRFMLQDAQVAAVFTERSLLPTLPSTHAPVVCLDAEVVMYLGEENITTCEKKRERSEADQVGLETQAYVLYTSGSTGYPKGVAMPHRAVSHLIQWQRSHSSCGVGSRTAQFASLSFDVSCQELFATWSAGGIVVLMDEATRHDPYEMQLFLQKEGIERLFLPVVALQQLADVEERKEEGALKLREIITAGEQLYLTPQLVDFFRRRPTCKLYNQYGPTESHVVAAYELKGPATAWAAFPPIGRPIDNVEFYVLDAYGQPTPRGVVGELYIGGIALARGYHRQPALTAERFVPHPFSQHPGARLYKTGDLVRYLPGGILEFQGRCDTQVKIRGFRVELGEIEAALMQHPLVHTAVVLAQDNAVGHKNLVAYIVTTKEHSLSVEKLRTHLQELLPSYTIPSVFIFLKEMPLSPNGKISRNSLPTPNRAHLERDNPFTPSRTPLEEILTGIWAEVLGLERVGIDDDFFILGGHSLLATQLISKIRHTLSVEIPLRDLFEAPTVAALVPIVRQRIGQDEIPAQPIKKSERGNIAQLLTKLNQFSDESTANLLSSLSLEKENRK